MPSLILFGRSFLVAPDDFWTFMWVFIVAHPVWAWMELQDLTFLNMAQSTTKFGVGEMVVVWDIFLCVAMVPIDAMIWVLSAWGSIMRPRKWEMFLHVLLYVRIASVVAFVPLLAYMVLPTLVWVFKNWEDPQTKHVQWWDLFKGGMLLVRLLIYLYTVAFVVLIVVPRHVYKGALSKAAQLALKVVGAQHDVFTSVVRLIMHIMHDELNLNKVAPTDILYGLMLVMAHQKQGPLGPDPDLDWKDNMEEENLLIEGGFDRAEVEKTFHMPVSVHRASQLSGVHRPLTMFDHKCEVDAAAMGEITYLMPFASGIYGPFLFGLPAKGFEEGTMCPKYACCAVANTMPCIQRLRPDVTWLEWARRRLFCLVPPCLCCLHDGRTEGDWCWGTMEDFMVDAVRQPALARGHEEPELLWASWTRHKPGEALPMSAFRDDEHKQFIVTVRGTANLKSVVDDLGVEPAFWDPLDMAGPDARKKPPFDDETDFFVPDVWLDISTDCVRMLKEKGVWQQLLDRPDYRVVVTGHSLGAGVGTLVALHLRRELRQKRVHFVGFEPPGCSLCPLLSKATQEMGWISVVCAYDWVPRLSVRNIQKLRELALDELENCDRSKFQLWLLLCAGICERVPYVPRWIRQGLSRPLEWLGGGPVGKTSTRNWCRYRVNPLKIARQEDSFPLMVPAGDVVFLRPVSTTWICGVLQKDTEWSGEWADPIDIQEEFIVCPRVVDLHVPWVYEHALGRVARRFTQGKVAEGKPFEVERTGGRRRHVPSNLKSVTF